jgi:hypothetical protein
MATTDIGEPSPRENQRTSQISDEVRSEIRQLLKSWAERTGFPLDELNRLQAKRQAAPPRIPANRAPVSAFVPDEEDVAFRQALEKDRELLRSLSPQTTFITLDHPDTIELIDPLPVKLFEKSIGPFSSFARLLVNIGGLPISDNPIVRATYKWTNNISEVLAVINVQTLLRIHCSYDIFAHAGVFDGNTNKLFISAAFSASVNGIMPATFFGSQTLATDEASAGGVIFGNDDVHVTNLVVPLVGFGANMMVVPAGADVSFFVDLVTDCRLDGDAVLGDEIDVNFDSTDQVPFPIFYPFLTIQVLAS